MRAPGQHLATHTLCSPWRGRERESQQESQESPSIYTLTRGSPRRCACFGIINICPCAHMSDSYFSLSEFFGLSERTDTKVKSRAVFAYIYIHTPHSLIALAVLAAKFV